MTEHSTEANSRAALPAALRQPDSRNVQLLLESRIPARIAWVDGDGHPQVAPMWFEWDGAELLISTFAGSRKLEDLNDGAKVAATIDTADFPYRSVRISGPVTLESYGGLTDSYRRAAKRYLGESAANAWCTMLEGKPQVLIRLQPTRASASDMSTMPFVANAPGQT